MTMKPATRRAQNGFTLIEALVSIVVISVALIGIAGMQLVSLKNNAESKYRSLAVQLASDLSERMRSNLDAALIDDANRMANPYNKPITTAADTAYAIDPGCGTLCGAGARAQLDLKQFQDQVKRLLPRGVGVVCIDSGIDLAKVPRFDGTTITPECDNQGSLFAVKIFWLDDRQSANDTLSNTQAYQVFTTRFSPYLF